MRQLLTILFIVLHRKISLANQYFSGDVTSCRFYFLFLFWSNTNAVVKQYDNSFAREDTDVLEK